LTDAAAIATLAGELGYPSAEADVRARLEDLRGRGADEEAYVAIGDDAVVGWIHVYRVVLLETSRQAEVGGLVVADGHRGRGVGQQLLRAAESWAIERGMREIRLRSNILRNDAHRFYRSHDYEMIATSYLFRKHLSR
jgi:GNAT superfamily N-acetyltransferase